MSKPPFEKVRSLVERRKLFESLVKTAGEIICKGDDDSLFQLKPLGILNETLLQAALVSIEKLPQHDINALGNFAVGADRYFFNGPLKIMKDEAALHLSCDVFLLQRRASFRLQIQANHHLSMAIIDLRGRATHTTAQISDISAGGARIYFSSTAAPGLAHMKNPGLQVGDRFKAVLHPPSGKTLDVACEVKHIQKSATPDGQMVEYFGIEFIELTTLVKNRLMAMTMDLQQKMVLEY